MSLPQKNTYRLHCFQPGLQYAEILEHWKLVKIGDAVDLIPEPENKEDQNAVKVVYQGKPLGYLPRSENRPIADIFKAGLKSYRAKIQSLYFDNPLFEQLEISLTVKKD